MKSMITLYFSVLCLIANISMAQEVLKELPKLKALRTYYYMEVITMTSHQFQVWYQNEKQTWKTVLVAGNENDDLSKLTPEQYLRNNTAYAGWPKPSAKFTPVPAQLQHLEAGIKQAILKNHTADKVVAIQVHYLGEAARIGVHELIPHSRGTDQNRSAGIADQYFFIPKGDKKMINLNQGSSGGSSRLSNLSYSLDKKAVASDWVDFIMPGKVEGSSLFSLNFKREGQPAPANIYTLQQAALEGQILKSFTQLEKAYKNRKKLESSLDRILQKQGDTEFPTESTQYLKYEFSYYGRHKDWSKQLDGRVEILIPVSRESFTRLHADEKSGIIFILSGNLAHGKLKLAAVDPSQNRVETEHIIDQSEYVLVDSGKSTFVEGYLDFQRGDTRKDLKLPGTGEFTSFDIYPAHSLRMHNLTLPGL